MATPKTKSGAGILWTVATIIMIGLAVVYFSGWIYQKVTGDTNTSPTPPATAASGKPAEKKGDFMSPKISFNIQTAPSPTPRPKVLSGMTVPLKKGEWSRLFTINPGQTLTDSYVGDVAVRYNRKYVFENTAGSKIYYPLGEDGMRQRDQLGNPIQARHDSPAWAYIFTYVYEVEYMSLDEDKSVQVSITGD